MNETRETILNVDDLTVVYHSGNALVHAVNGVSFSLRRGETLALVGETGAGKTTIARAILQILPQPQAEIRSGSIRFEGQEFTEMPERELTKIRGAKIAMIFQDPMTALNPLMTVGDQIMEGLLLHNDYTQGEAKARARELLEMVGIPGVRAVEYPFEFSGGMKQRVIIAMALACNPDLLLADEPTSMIDACSRSTILDMLTKLRDEINMTVIFITHDIGLAYKISDKVYIMEHGKFVESGDAEEVIIHPKADYTKRLISDVPKIYEEWDLDTVANA